SFFARGRRLLDEVQNHKQLEGFDPAAVARALAEEAPPAGQALADLGAQLDAARGLLGELDRFAQKEMRIRLLHAADPLPAQLRTLRPSTIVAYERDRALLRERVGYMLARVAGAAAGAATDRVLEMAERVLETRARLRQGVLELARGIAGAWLP